MTSSQDQISQIHQMYIRSTGLSIPLTMRCIYAWEIWIAKGFTVADLSLVVQHLRMKYRGDRLRFLQACRFIWLIENTDSFGEHLAEAKALARRPVPNQPRESVLNATGRRTDLGGPPARSAAQILAGKAAFEDFKRMAKEL